MGSTEGSARMYLSVRKDANPLHLTQRDVERILEFSVPEFEREARVKYFVIFESHCYE